MNKQLDYYANPLQVEHHTELYNLLEDYRALFYSGKLKGDVDYIIRLDRITEQLDMIISE